MYVNKLAEKKTLWESHIENSMRMFMFSYSYKEKKNLSKHQGNDYALDRDEGSKLNHQCFTSISLQVI